MDEGLAALDRDALVAEVKRLRAGIRAHRDSSGHELCWHHPQLWSLLPGKSDPHLATLVGTMLGGLALRRRLMR